MIIKGMPLGPVQANCYVVGCEETREAAVIDPGDEGERVLDVLAKHNLTAKVILNTHGHFDHVGGNAELKEATGAELIIHTLDAPMLGQLTQTARLFGLFSENSPEADRLVEHGDEIQVGQMAFKVIHTPGHTPGGVSFLVEDKVFVGDTLFAGSVGRTDLPGGDTQTLINSIRKQLFVLDDATEVYPGHMGMTTIGQEKRFNPFVGGR